MKPLILSFLLSSCCVGLGFVAAKPASNSNGADSDKILVCYFIPSPPFLNASMVPVDLCTHVIYAFAQVSPDGIQPDSPGDTKSYKDLIARKKLNPDLKILLSLQKGFSTVVDKGEAAMITFSQKAVAFLTSYGFDGVDLDWEFPTPSEKVAYGLFIKIISAHLKTKNLLLSSALLHGSITEIYDVGALAAYMDFITIMTYDYNGYSSTNNKTGYNSPLFSPLGEGPMQSTHGSMAYMVSVGLPANKLLVGVPTYGRSWTLASPDNHGLHAPAVGEGSPAPFSRSVGVYTYMDVVLAEETGANLVYDGINGAQYLYNGTTWVGFDGIFSITEKMNWLKNTDFRGVGVWAMHLDDILGWPTKFPLLKCMKKNMFG